MFSYFENQKTILFDVLCLTFRIETKNQNFIYNFAFQFIKRNKMVL